MQQQHELQIVKLCAADQYFNVRVTGKAFRRKHPALQNMKGEETSFHEGGLHFISCKKWEQTWHTPSHRCQRDKGRKKFLTVWHPT
jgi:hypothetical protein